MSDEDKDRLKKDATTTELEISLKSMLSELPPPGAGWAVEVYVVTDGKAAGRVGDMLAKTGLNGTRWAVYSRLGLDFDCLPRPFMRDAIRDASRRALASISVVSSYPLVCHL